MMKLFAFVLALFPFCESFSPHLTTLHSKRNGICPSWYSRITVREAAHDNNECTLGPSNGKNTAKDYVPSCEISWNNIQ